MRYTENTYSTITTLYTKAGNVYSSFSFMPWFVIIICLYVMFVYCVKIEVNSSSNWNMDKCSSKYVFFSGFMYNEGKDPYIQTMDNFVNCINPYYNNKINKIIK